MADKINIAVFISGNGTDLQAIIDSQDIIIKHGQVSFVFSSSPTAYGVMRATDHGIDVFCLNERVTGAELFYLMLEKKLREHSIDLIVLAGYIPKLSGDFVNRWRKKIINIHPSLLPKYGGKGYYGLKVHQAVLDNSDEYTGATIHYVTENLDEGEIIAQRNIRVKATTARELQYQVLSSVEWKMLPEVVEKLCLEMLLNNKNKINVAVIGAGGREHALVRKITESSLVRRVICIPGNAGIIEADKINISVCDQQNIVDTLLNEKVKLCVVGPELPISYGLADKIRSAGIQCFAPSKSAAKIETSKVFAKKFMKKHHIPTASYHVFNEYEEAENFMLHSIFPVVVKADGLCGGKGTFICHNIEEALKSLKLLMVERVYGDSGRSVIVEEYLQGVEASVMVITDGNKYVLLPSAKDYKKAFDGDEGPNTGSMGAIAPHPAWSETVEKECINNIIEPTIAALQDEGINYSGCLYFGIILTTNGIKVLEYNCRFGDPEIEAVLPLVTDDLVPLFLECSSNELKQLRISTRKGYCCAVVLASIGYPRQYEIGKELKGIINNDIISCAVKEDNNHLISNGGRVVCSIGMAESIENARKKAYENASKIKAQGLFYRKDIGN